MASAKQMLDTHPRAFDVDAGLLAKAIDLIVECASICTQCADACLAEEDVADLVRCIRLDLDCADVCVATSRVVSRRTEHDIPLTRAQLRACLEACRICAEECERHAERMEHCRVCAEACRRCEDVCRELLNAIS